MPIARQGFQIHPEKNYPGRNSPHHSHRLLSEALPGPCRCPFRTCFCIISDRRRCFELHRDPVNLNLFCNRHTVSFRQIHLPFPKIGLQQLKLLLQPMQPLFSRTCIRLRRGRSRRRHINRLVPVVVDGVRRIGPGLGLYDAVGSGVDVIEIFSVFTFVLSSLVSPSIAGLVALQ